MDSEVENTIAELKDFLNEQAYKTYHLSAEIFTIFGGLSRKLRKFKNLCESFLG